ncbi:MAG: mechanosensitive ion channel family protein [Deltaproteobacteria bacterium]|nr:mechanosensitive ion channel family protein [Deltaproteobacteria bacterium]
MQGLAQICIKQLTRLGLPPAAAEMIWVTASLVLLGMAAGLVSRMTRRFLIPFLLRATSLSKSDWDDRLAENQFFQPLTLLVPLVFCYSVLDLLFTGHPVVAAGLGRLVMVLLVFPALRMVKALLTTIEDIYKRNEISRRKPIGGYLSVLRIILYILAGIFMFSTLTDRSPWGFFSVFGGLTAIVLLVFKDTILGFVASLQLAGYDMVRVGDWIEMGNAGADGEVVEVSITTVKVRNWDKTITTIPTYSLVADAFKNWRGMSESGGRRIKRALLLDIGSVHFCPPAEAARLREIRPPHGHPAAAADPGVERPTNLGLFRSYVKSYLCDHPRINQNMTLLVRHLAPTEKGQPLEIYAFSRDQEWAVYEDLQADIFDHLLAILPEFGLRAFQEPGGADLTRLGGGGDGALGC